MEAAPMLALLEAAAAGTGQRPPVVGRQETRGPAGAS